MRLQNVLTQAITISCRRSRMVRRAIAFDAQQIAPRGIRVHDGKINEESGDPNLVVDLTAELDECILYGLLERRIRGASVQRGYAQIPAFGVFQEGLERRHAKLTAFVDTDILREDAGEHLAALTRSGDEHVQAPVPTIRVQRPEVLIHLVVALRPTIAD